MNDLPTLNMQIYLAAAREKQQRKIKHCQQVLERTKSVMACSEHLVFNQ